MRLLEYTYSMTGSVVRLQISGGTVSDGDQVASGNGESLFDFSWD